MSLKKMRDKVHVLKAKMTLDQETYRALLKNLTGQESSKDLTKELLVKVIEYMSAQIAQDTPENKNSLIEQIYQLTQAQGKHRNYASAIAGKIGNKKLIQCSAYQLQQVLDAIKAQAEREVV